MPLGRLYVDNGDLGLGTRLPNDLEELAFTVSLHVKGDNAGRAVSPGRAVGHLEASADAGELRVEEVRVHEREDTRYEGWVRIQPPKHLMIPSTIGCSFCVRGERKSPHGAYSHRAVQAPEPFHTPILPLANGIADKRQERLYPIVPGQEQDALGLPKGKLLSEMELARFHCRYLRWGDGFPVPNGATL